MSNPPKSPIRFEFPSSVPVQITTIGLYQFLDISPDVLIIVNQGGTMMMVNKLAEVLFGYHAEELLGQPLELLLPQCLRETHIVHRDRYFSVPQTRPVGTGLHLFGRHEDGTEFPVDISLRPVLLDNELHVIGAIRDLTEQKALEEQLQRKNRAFEETNRLKGEIISKMLHDLRTPITTIMGFTEIMYNGEVEDSNEQHEYLGDILASSRRMLQLINDAVDLAATSGG